MRRTDAEDHGPVRHGPPLPADGLPVLPELSAVLAATANRSDAQPVGGAPPCWRPPAATGPGGLPTVPGPGGPPDLGAPPCCSP